ncbi:hypothetical protein AX17_006468 [Amanita inopinata Kibby_2008]|nr:hypothetical protein AX17_006468 [Amanita inopinata Kibby_2008]
MTIPACEKLPDEIIREIFVLQAHDYGQVSIPYGKDQVPPQVTASHACSRWRRVALNTRELWSDIRIERFHDEGIRKAHYVPVREWLSRTMRCPVTMQLDLRTLPPSPSPSPLPPPHLSFSSSTSDAFSAFFRNVTVPFQLGKLTLAAHFQQLFQVSNTLSDALVHLTHLDLTLVTYPGATTHLRQLLMEGGGGGVPAFLKHVRSLCFWSGDLDLDENPLDRLEDFGGVLPWGGLRRVGFRWVMVSLERCVELLRRTAELEECQVVLSAGDEGDDGDNSGEDGDDSDDEDDDEEGEVVVRRFAEEDVITLPNLHTLDLELKDYTFDRLIRHLKLPNLTKLRLYNCTDDAWTSRTWGLVKQQFDVGQLREICIGESQDVLISIYELLEDAPCLSRMEIYTYATMEMEAVEGLANGRVGRCLEILDVFARCEVEEMLGMVEGRQRLATGHLQTARGGDPLLSAFKFVRLRSASIELGASIHARIAKLKELGVEVRVEPESKRLPDFYL